MLFFIPGVTMREKKGGALQKLKKRLSHSFGRLCKFMLKHYLLSQLLLSNRVLHKSQYETTMLFYNCKKVVFCLQNVLSRLRFSMTLECCAIAIFFAWITIVATNRFGIMQSTVGLIGMSNFDINVPLRLITIVFSIKHFFDPCEMEINYIVDVIWNSITQNRKCKWEF